MQWFHKVFADNTNSRSFASQLRRKRYLFFKRLLNQISRPVRILDVGGREKFWEMIGVSEEDCQITLLNLRIEPLTLPNFISVIGDARSMKQFPDAEFDVVFSNSVIEHLGSYDHQQQMAAEIKRVGKAYFVQTPNKFFPIEPHFEFPLFQFLPIGTRTWMACHFDLGWYCRFTSFEAAKEEVESIRLLSRSELMNLFPEALLYEERFAGLTKSFMAYYGFEKDASR